MNECHGLGGDILAFSENLAKLQREEDVSNYRLAKHLGVTPTTISNWKNGTTPPLDKAAAIAAFFHTTVDELIDEKKG